MSKRRVHKQNRMAGMAGSAFGSDRIRTWNRAGNLRNAGHTSRENWQFIKVKPTNSNKRWIKGIRRWLLKIFRKSPSPTQAVLERSIFPACILLRLEPRSAGGSDVWKIIPKAGFYDFLVEIDSFRALKLQINKEAKLRVRRGNVQAWKHPLLPESRELLKWQPDQNDTHLFWILKISRVPLNGQIRKQCVGVWPLDLEGFTPAWAGYERSAQVIMRCAVCKICALPQTQFETAVVNEEHWISQIGRCAKAFIGPRHEI